MPRLKHLILAVFASVTFVAEAFAASVHGFDAVTNETLYTAMLRYMRTMQTELVAGPSYFMVQNLMLEIEAAHAKKPYAWVGQIHRFLNLAENMYPAAMGHPASALDDRYEQLRRALLRLRDYPMHQVSDVPDDIGPAVGQAEAFTADNKQWIQHKRDEFFQFLSAPAPTGSEMQVYKLYSSGVVFRTKSACIGTDITYAEGTYDGERREELAQKLDVFFLTHAHGDHYDIPLLRRMLELGKVVVAPYTMERHLTSFAECKGKTLFLWDNDGPTDEPATVWGNVKTQAFRSVQDPEPLLLYLLEADGWRIILVGDNSDKKKEDAFANYPTADVVATPIFVGLTTLFSYTLAAPNPADIDQIYINLHENEWHHTIQGRIPFSYMFNDHSAFGNASVTYPLYVATDCGESFTLYK